MMNRYMMVAVLAFVACLSPAPAEAADDGAVAGQTEAGAQAGVEQIPRELALELIDVLQIGDMLEQASARSEQAVERAVAGELSGQGKLSQAQLEIYDGMQREMAAVYAEALDWEKMRPGVVAAVRKSFTREEAEGIVAFYDTPAGRAMKTKVPAVLGQTMQRFEAAMMQVVPRVQEIERDARDRADAAGAAADGDGSADAGAE